MAKILIVEDDADCRDILIELLELDGHDVVCRATGEEGLESASHELPDIALLDIALNGSAFDGHETMRRLRALPGGDGLPIVAVSASIRRHRFSTPQVDGFSAAVPKPYTVDEIEQILRRFLVHRSVPPQL